MPNHKEREHQWEKTGKESAASSIAHAFTGGHHEALVELLYDVAYSAEELATQERDCATTEPETLVTGAARLYWMLGPLRRCLDRELVILGEKARDADEQEKDGEPR